MLPRSAHQFSRFASNCSFRHLVAHALRSATDLLRTCLAGRDDDMDMIRSTIDGMEFPATVSARLRDLLFNSLRCSRSDDMRPQSFSPPPRSLARGLVAANRVGTPPSPGNRPATTCRTLPGQEIADRVVHHVPRSRFGLIAALRVTQSLGLASLGYDCWDACITCDALISTLPLVLANRLPNGSCTRTRRGFGVAQS